MFVWCFSSHSRIFHSYGDITITSEGLQIWPMLGNYGHLAVCLLACQTYCDTGHPIIMVISEDPWHSHLLPSVWRGAVTTCYNDLRLSRLGFELPTFRLRCNALTYCATVVKITISITTQISKVFRTLLLQWNLFNATCSGIEMLCWYRQSVGLQSKKTHWKWSKKYEISCQMSQWNRLYRFYCIWNLNPNWSKLVINKVFYIFIYMYILKFVISSYSWNLTKQDSAIFYVSCL